MPENLPEIHSNPNNTTTQNVPETLVTFATPITIPALHGKAELELTYTPDKHLITPDALLSWLDTLIKNGNHQTWEDVAGTITHIFYDTLLPKHIALSLHINATKHQHTIEMVKQQP